MTASDISGAELAEAKITDLLLASGCSEVKWLFPEETYFYQPIGVAGK